MYELRKLLSFRPTSKRREKNRECIRFMLVHSLIAIAPVSDRSKAAPSKEDDDLANMLGKVELK